MVGFAAHRVLSDRGRRVVGTVRSAAPELPCTKDLKYIAHVDLSDLGQVEKVIDRIAPSTIINCAAIKTATGDIAVNEMFAINALLPKMIKEMAESRNAHFIHISTDGVFDGQAAPYSEESKVNPIGSYSLSKFLGEVTGPTSLTIRTSFIGRSLSGNSTLVDWVLASANSKISGYSKSVFSGIPAHIFAEFLHNHIITAKNMVTGLLDVPGPPIDKLTLIKLIADRWQVEGVDIGSDDSRISNLSLTSSRNMDLSEYSFPDWQEMVDSLYQFYAQCSFNKTSS